MIFWTFVRFRSFTNSCWLLAVIRVPKRTADNDRREAAARQKGIPGMGGAGYGLALSRPHDIIGVFPTDVGLSKNAGTHRRGREVFPTDVGLSDAVLPDREHLCFPCVQGLSVRLGIPICAIEVSPLRAGVIGP